MVKILQIDAFTHTPFGGNPAAVCLLETAASDRWMQEVAAEMNLSETAFVLPLENETTYHLRWFTPTTEVDLCGHATLATAHALWTETQVPATATLCFQTRSGLLQAQLQDGWISLNFPANPSTPLTSIPQGLGEALGLAQAPIAVAENTLGYLLEVQTPDLVQSLAPNFASLQGFPVAGMIVTSAGSSPYDFTSRFFAPNLGINEDPVTGAAHCCLAPYWSQRLGKREFLAYQASVRGGILKVQYPHHRDGESPESDRVILQGQAVTVLRGELL